MEYRSPLGYNFKLDQSLSASKEEKNKDSPKGNNFTCDNSSRQNKYFFESDSKRISGGNRTSFSPARQRHSNTWKSPRNSQTEPPSVEQFYHPSMLEDPWEELEKNKSDLKKE